MYQTLTHFVLRRLPSVARRYLSSPRFFYAIVGFLVLNAGWIALTGRYPQAFDENYHLGLIQLHAAQWLPFFTAQPPGDALYGALARDPSYLYHFLFSIPYRLLTAVTDSQVIQVIVLRFMNIGIFVGGLFVYRALLRRLGASQLMNNAILLFFVLLPISSLLAAQINYDNLMFLLVGWLFLLVVRYYQQLVAPGARFPAVVLLQIITIGAFGSLVKFPFMAIFVACLVGVIIVTIRAARGSGLGFVGSLAGLSKLRLLGLGLVAAIAIGLCVERYGVNLVKYHDPVPACDIVLSVADCQAYSPWARDYLYAQVYPKPTTQGIAVYPFVWVHRMVYETMFVISSTYGEEDTGNTVKVYYFGYDPLPLANAAAWAVTLLGGLGLLVFWRQIWRNVPLRTLLLMCGFYTAVLFVQNFQSYLTTGEVVAVHGRYLVPVFPIILLALAYGMQAGIRRLRLERFSMLLALVLFVLLLQGGGAITWIMRSEHFWSWPYHPLAGQANQVAQSILRYIVLR